MSKEYEVGKLVYLMCEKKFSIVPALIVEEVVRKTLDNVDVSYMISKAGSKDVVNLSEVQQDVFTNIEEVLSNRKWVSWGGGHMRKFYILERVKNLSL